MTFATATTRPDSAARPLTLRQFAAAYGVDLALSMTLVLIAARVWGAFHFDDPQSIWVINLQAAVARFTPFALWDVYSEQTQSAIATLAGHVADSGVSGLFIGLQLLCQFILAAPATLGAIWEQSSGVSDWLTFVGFGGVLLATFVLMVKGGQLSLGRLLLAAVISPLAASGLFWTVQHTLLDMLDGFGWLTQMAPWFLVCPAICTAYWLIFPHARHGGATALLRLATELNVSLRIGRNGRRRDNLASMRPRK